MFFIFAPGTASPMRAAISFFTLADDSGGDEDDSGGDDGIKLRNRVPVMPYIAPNASDLPILRKLLPIDAIAADDMPRSNPSKSNMVSGALSRVIDSFSFRCSAAHV